MDGEDKPGFVPPGWRRRGFKTFEGFNRGHRYYNSITFTDDGQKMDAAQKYEPTLQTDLAIEFMKKNRTNPFFCFLSWGPPHTPYKPPEKYKIMYEPDEIKLRPNVRGKHNKQAACKDLANYFGLCTSLDHEWGKLMGALDILGIADNTLVVFTADHGDLHYSHGKKFKNEPEEESLHVPLIMRMPRTIKPGQQVENLVSSVDLMPTILSLCNLTVPGTCTGTDKSGAVKGTMDPDSSSIYAEQGACWRTVLQGRYKLVMWGKGKTAGPEQLYDLEKDPYELNNIINESSHAKILKNLIAQYKTWKKRTNDPFPNNPRRAKQMYTGI
jgi:arylsulfatase A-like enzyme